MRMMRCARIIKNARREAQHAISAFQSARGRLPAPREPGIEELSICGLVIPDGDRRHCAESRCVVDETSTLERNQDIVRVLVLRENGFDIHSRALRASPVQRALERVVRCDDPRKSFSGRLVEIGVIDQRDHITSTVTAPAPMSLPSATITEGRADSSSHSSRRAWAPEFQRERSASDP